MSERYRGVIKMATIQMRLSDELYERFQRVSQKHYLPLTTWLRLEGIKACDAFEEVHDKQAELEESERERERKREEATARKQAEREESERERERKREEAEKKKAYDKEAARLEKEADRLIAFSRKHPSPESYLASLQAIDAWHVFTGQPRKALAELEKVRATVERLGPVPAPPISAAKSKPAPPPPDDDRPGTLVDEWGEPEEEEYNGDEE